MIVYVLALRHVGVKIREDVHPIFGSIKIIMIMMIDWMDDVEKSIKENDEKTYSGIWFLLVFRSVCLKTKVVFMIFSQQSI